MTAAATARATRTAHVGPGRYPGRDHVALAGNTWTHALRANARRLRGDDRDAVLAHLLRLPADDRRMRFCSASNDDLLAAYVARMDFSRNAIFGVVDGDGTVVAIGEALIFDGPRGRAVEAAFTTDTTVRRRGLARALFDTILEWAAVDGRDEIVLHCDGRNWPMRGLLEDVGASMNIDDDGIEAVTAVDRH